MRFTIEVCKFAKQMVVHMNMFINETDKDITLLLSICLEYRRFMNTLNLFLRV